MQYLDIFSNIPIAVMKKAKEDPPALIKGRGSPVAGIEAVTTAIFIRA